MKLLTLLRWELVQVVRGSAPHMAATLVSFGSATLVAAGILALSLWNPFTPVTPTFPGRTDSSNTPSLTPIIGEFRGGVAFFLVLVWLLLVATAIGPALVAATVVRDRRSGRLDRILTDTGRADLVAVAKLLATLLPLGLILATAAPAASFAWLLGGLATSNALAGLAVLTAASVLVVALALLCAASATTEVTAVLMSYVLAGLFLVGPLVAGTALAVAGRHATANTVVSFDPLIGALASQPQLAVRLARLIGSDWPTPEPAVTLGTTTVPVWAADAATYLVVAAALVWLAGLILEPLHPLKTWRLRQVSLTR